MIIKDAIREFGVAAMIIPSSIISLRERPALRATFVSLEAALLSSITLWASSVSTAVNTDNVYKVMH